MNGIQPAAVPVHPLNQATSITRAARARPMPTPIRPECSMSRFITEETSWRW
ncbi:hypothetical protein D3C78_1733500 [compost metagenome]